MWDLTSLNPQQRRAVETAQGPVLILAGAGTGKTRVITYRIAHLIEQGIAPGNILGVTFTNKAALEMQERVNQLVSRSSRNFKTRTQNRELPSRPTLCTFHSLCVRILRQHIEKLGYKRNFVIYDESDQLGVIKKILSRISARSAKPDPAATLALLSRFRNGGAASGGDAGLATIVRHVRPRYESALRACNVVDFDGLILLALQLFKEHPGALGACRENYRYVMVDEYQDTNASQFELVHALTREHRNLCVVGDDDQSIYGWRGAQIANLLDLEKHFPEVKVFKLEQNYRSTNTILSAANALIKNNARRRPKQLWSAKGQGSKITLHTFKNEEEEARTIVEEIDFLRRARTVLWSRQAILFRTNIQSRPLETALRQAGVRYHLVGGQSFFDRREVRDFLAYLKVFLNPDDDVSLLRIANVPARGLSEATMERLLSASQEHQCPVFGAMTNPVVQAAFPAKTRESIAAFVEFIQRCRAQLADETLARDPQALQKWAMQFVAETGYVEELRRSEKEVEAAEGRVRNLQDLAGSMDEGERGSLPPLERLQFFLEELTLDRDREAEEETSGEAVTLITMHSCKGLEFPHVYIVGLEDGLLPHARSEEERTLDEERRLFYVAITRAQESLTLSYCRGRKKFGETTPCHPSRFLKELPPELIEHADEKARQPVAVDAGRNLFAAMRSAAE